MRVVYELTRKNRTWYELNIPAPYIQTASAVAMMTTPQRERRVNDLIKISHDIMNVAIDVASHDAYGDKRNLKAIVGLFSGGNDSTCLVHIMRDSLTHLGFINTGVGVTVTHDYVRQTAGHLGIPLIEASAVREEDTYEYLVEERGFPGPGMHTKIYNRLKERGIYEIRRQFIQNQKWDRMLFVAGRRWTESNRRNGLWELDRHGSRVFVSPIILWTKLDLNTYRQMYNVPINPVYEILHMSGECCCGCFAQKGEREWLFKSFPNDPCMLKLKMLETKIAGREDIPAIRKIWGCGGTDKGCTTGMCNE